MNPDGQKPDGCDIAFSRGTSWRLGGAVLAVFVSSHDGGYTVAQAMAEDSSGVTLRVGRSIRTADGQIARVQFGTDPDPHESLWVAVANVQCGDRVAAVVLSSNTRGAYTRSLSTWRRLVQSFRLDGIDPIDDRERTPPN